MTFDRRDIRIPMEDGVGLGAWLFLPEASGPWPAITMAHGYCCTRWHGIEPFAQAFAEAGFVVLLHDHRGFGDSGGEPRQDIDPWQQITDWRRVISCLQDRPEVDAERVGLWGTSYAGGHAIVLGATDRRLKAVVAQVPTTYGHESALRRVPPERVDAMQARFGEDERARFHGAAPVYQTLVGADTGAAYADPIAADYYLRHAPAAPLWSNQVTLRSTRWARMYTPGGWVDQVSPTPLMMIVGMRDVTTITSLALRAYGDALEPKRLVTFDGDHFDSYEAAFRGNAGAAVDWFREHL